MKTKFLKYIIVGIASLLIGSDVSAQSRDSVIDMESEFTGERKIFLRDANKISTNPIVKEQVVEMTTIQYSTLPTRRTVTIEPKPIAAAKINVEDKLPRLYRGYIRAGAGSYFTTPVDFYYTAGRPILFQIPSVIIKLIFGENAFSRKQHYKVVLIGSAMCRIGMVLIIPSSLEVM
jgi:hypothetical protein